MAQRPRITPLALAHLVTVGELAHVGDEAAGRELCPICDGVTATNTPANRANGWVCDTCWGQATVPSRRPQVTVIPATARQRTIRTRAQVLGG